MTQKQMVIAHLRQSGSLTQMEALKLYGIGRLASRIDELRQNGWSIVTKRERRNGKSFGRYELLESAK